MDFKCQVKELLNKYLGQEVSLDELEVILIEGFNYTPYNFRGKISAVLSRLKKEGVVEEVRRRILITEGKYKGRYHIPLKRGWYKVLDKDCK